MGQPGDEPSCGGLSRTGFSNQAKCGAFLDGETDSVNRFDLTPVKQLGKPVASSREVFLESDNLYQ